MSLSGWDQADLDRLAASYADQGKTHAWRAYTEHAIANAWGNTPTWVEGRTFFVTAWRKHRAEYRETNARLRGMFGEADHPPPDDITRAG